MGARPALTKGYNRHYYVSNHALLRARERLGHDAQAFRSDGDFGNLVDQCVWQGVQDEMVEEIEDLDGKAMVVNLVGTSLEGLYAVVHDEQSGLENARFEKVVRTLLTKDQVENNKATRWNKGTRGINSLKEQLAPLLSIEKLQEERKAHPVVKKEEATYVTGFQDARVVQYADPGAPTRMFSKLLATKEEYETFLVKVRADAKIDQATVQVLKPNWTPVKKKVVVEFEE